ncbi:histidine kinase [Polaribacter sp. Z014]|uniref:sensor histidine kinase n=1 Tax=Polaribacter sp. Z014 TaxID=2927126 RepID=UPI00201FE9E5|nr:histidine kinase [Polaribacter sp. Z014]MCL7763422.1 histidine kinase [Polaribacter sp. Z014]
MKKNLIFLIFFLIFFLIKPIHSQENQLQNFSISDGLPSTVINNIVQDEIGYLWIATDNGYSKFDGVNFTNYKQEKATCIFIEKGKIYIGLKTGLLLLQNNKSTFYESKEILKIKSIRNKIVLATVQGVCELKKDYIQPLKINTQIDFSIINDIISFKNSIYIASIKGLWSIDKLYKPLKVNRILEENSTSLLINKNQLIASTYNKGLKIIGDNSILKSISTLENISSIKKINDEIWVTSQKKGIDILDANTYLFNRKINKYNAAISDKINTVFKDNHNSVWIASLNKGLYKYSTAIAIVKPTIFIESIAVNYKLIDSLNIAKLALKPNENNISFSFKTINLKSPKNIEYRYQLNNEFTPWSHQNKVDFANLKAGDYTFTIQSKEGSLLSKKVSFSFFIETPIYQKAWFLILCGVLLCLLLAAIIEIYIRKTNKKNQQKITALETENHVLTLEQKALQLQMNPHFIFNVLNGIKALGNSGNSKELNKTISQFSILLRSILNNSRLEEISLQDEIDTLKNYLDLEQKMNSKSFNYSIETALNNIDSEEILIPPMLLQPFVENCIKHAFLPNKTDATIKLLFEIKNKFLYFTIEDNGIGFHQSKKVKSNHQSVALEVTKERILHLTKYNSFSMEEIKEKNEIKGTKVMFKIPLKTDY